MEHDWRPSASGPICKHCGVIQGKHKEDHCAMRQRRTERDKFWTEQLKTAKTTREILHIQDMRLREGL